VPYSPTPLAGATYTYSVAPGTDVSGCSLPAGVVFDAATGTVAGTPTAAGMFACWVRLTVAVNGVTFTVSAQNYVRVN
jgi:hypothetical protein